ncbi:MULTISPECIES: universal stress protein [unclassified Cupriavidus]|uniref:universal stress protein n=1 Tax=unclassified Cupriavidus TaxID=2640874 RepID=UPI00226FCC9B|nr:universal stress protein [Cupriavidus sp. D39]MCY0854697.1 universal stress protein [Cupriavidus sp. D39]
MFKHLLVPTDGSPLSEAAIRMAVTLAKGFQARITGFHAIPEYRIFTHRVEMMEDTQERFAQIAEQHAEHYLGMIAQAAREAGVPCDTIHVTSDHPYEAIIRAVEEHNCDLIVMASHGRAGVQGLLIGSETQKVLTHSTIPVLVYR